MKGTVAPPSSSATVASTCSARTPSSCAIFWLIFATREPLYPSTHRGRRTTGCGTPLMDQSGLIHQGAADDRRQGIFCRSDAISPQSWVRRRRRTYSVVALAKARTHTGESIYCGRQAYRTTSLRQTHPWGNGSWLSPGRRGGCLDTLTDTL